jgi:hypothetical protein
MGTVKIGGERLERGGGARDDGELKFAAAR